MVQYKRIIGIDKRINERIALKKVLIASSALNLLVLVAFVGLTLHTNNVLDALRQQKSAPVIVQTNSKGVDSMTCTGRVDQTITGSTTPSNGRSIESSIANGSAVTLKSNYPVVLICQQ